MKKSPSLYLITLLLFSCSTQFNNKTTVGDETLYGSLDELKKTQQPALQKDRYVDTRSEYLDSTNQGFIIENSLPKGGLKLTGPDGQDFTYAVFWTQLSNETNDTIDLLINFPEAIYELPFSVNNHCKVLLPLQKMNMDSVATLNYGLSGLNSFVDFEAEFHPYLQKAINPKDTFIFYVLLTFKKGLNGNIRTGFSARNQSLFYRINDVEFRSGHIRLKI